MNEGDVCARPPVRNRVFDKNSVSPHGLGQELAAPAFKPRCASRNRRRILASHLIQIRRSESGSTESRGTPTGTPGCRCDYLGCSYSDWAHARWTDCCSTPRHAPREVSASPRNAGLGGLLLPYDYIPANCVAQARLIRRNVGHATSVTVLGNTNFSAWFRLTKFMFTIAVCF
jgi:hypothetical protein